MAKLTVRDMEISGKWVLLRADFNVPVENGVDDISFYDQKLRATLPTIFYLIERNCRVILCSHLGRPNGVHVSSLSIRPIADRLSTLISRPISVIDEFSGSAVNDAISNMSHGDICMLENLRFNPGEEANDLEFAKGLASLADIFVMDAFAVAHRIHASTVGISQYKPSLAGLLLEKELQVMGDIMMNPIHPLGLVLGGAKVSDKIPVIYNFLDKVDRIFVGGGMAVAFSKALGYPVGSSIVDYNQLDILQGLICELQKNNITIYLPRDVVVAKEFSQYTTETDTVSLENVPDGWYIMDIGHETIDNYTEGISGCKTIIWNGPMGVFEFDIFANGTKGVASAISGVEGITLVGGGSTYEAMEELNLTSKVTHVSTGGGASLEFLGGKSLPGIDMIPDRMY